MGSLKDLRTPTPCPHLGLGAVALLPLAAASQVAQPLPAIRPLAVDVVVLQDVPGAAAELPLGQVDLARPGRLRKKTAESAGSPHSLTPPTPRVQELRSPAHSPASCLRPPCPGPV